MTQNNTVALATVSTYDKVQDPMTAATTLGEWIAKSGMFGCERVEQGAILAMQCLVERKAPLELAKHYHIIGGKLSLRADAMLALYRERGGKVRWLQFDDLGAKARWTYDGNDVELAYTAEDAKRAGFLPARAGSGWAKFPAEMMRARLISKAVRMLAPEVCTGTYTPEELEDIQRPAPATVAVGVTTSSTTAPAPAPVAVEVNIAEAEVVPAEEDGLTPQKQIFKLLTDADLLHAGRSFLKSKNWIPADGNLSMLSEARSAKILAKPEAFLAAVKSYQIEPTAE
jgi:hypothetical protein